MSWEISWANMCRACMEVKGVLLPLYDEDNESSENDLPSKLAEISSVEISKSDGLPTKICKRCVYKTNALFAFRSLVQESDLKLRQMFDQEDYNVDNESKTLENECLDEDINFIKVQNCAYSCEQYDTDSVLHMEKENTNLEVSDAEVACIIEIDEIKQEEFDATIIHDNEDHDSQVQSDDINIENNQHPELIENNANESQIIETQNSCKFEESEGLVHEQCDENLKTEEEDANDSDFEAYLETNDNIVGSLNDTITKVKEVKEDGKIVKYECTLCLQGYPELVETLNHIVELHVPKSGPFYCVVCELDCDSIKQLRRHIKTHKGPTPYICFLCNKAYVMKRYLKRHMACHTEFPRHRCAKCGERFKVKSELDAHMASHNDGKKFHCSQCPRVFNHKGNYKRHLITHLDPQGLHLPKYPCTICKRRFLNNRTLVTHMRVHTGEKPYKCNTCGKSFSQQGNLFNHQKIHTNPRSFTCEVCGKSFNQKATLKDHSLLHSGEKPHVCTVCGMSFTFGAALRRHAWSHTDDKPFECDICDAQFIARYDLKRHLKIHSMKETVRRSTPRKPKETTIIEVPEEIINIVEDGSETDTIFVEQIFLCNDSIQIVSKQSQEDSEKGNVDSLLGLIQYT